MNELTLAPDPSLVETLATMRSWLPPDLLHGIRSGRADHFCAFSDFSAPPRAQYETYATYILDSVRKVELLDRLRALRREHGIEERMPDFKSRRDRLKARILQPWVEAFADIAAGALAESLKLGPNRDARLAPRVDETWPLLDGLGAFQSAASASGEQSRLLLLVHDPVSPTDSEWRRAELTRKSREG